MEAAETRQKNSMGITEILFIVLGVALVVVSFLVPEKYEKGSPRDTQAEEEKIKEFLDQQLKQAEFQFEEKMEETVSSVTDKAERYMERISNEKMMALNEYSDTVLDTIHKNHEEAVFLYDMLNNKHAQVKNTAAEINHTVADVRKKVEEVKELQETQEVRETREEPAVGRKAAETKALEVSTAEAPGFTPLEVETLRVEIPKQEEAPAEEKKAPVKRRTPAKKTTSRAKKKTEAPAENEELLDAQMDNGMNNNDRILQVHKEGKSNMAIAKTLGLGVGEVKLVIDLFEGA